MPRDTWSPSAARENVITVPPLYIFINEALIGIRGNVPGFEGGKAPAQRAEHGRPFESIVITHTISGHERLFNATYESSVLCVLCCVSALVCVLCLLFTE